MGKWARTLKAKSRDGKSAKNLESEEYEKKSLYCCCIITKAAAKPLKSTKKPGAAKNGAVGGVRSLGGGVGGSGGGKWGGGVVKGGEHPALPRGGGGGGGGGGRGGWVAVKWGFGGEMRGWKWGGRGWKVRCGRPGTRSLRLLEMKGKGKKYMVYTHMEETKGVKSKGREGENKTRGNGWRTSFSFQNPICQKTKKREGVTAKTKIRKERREKGWQGAPQAK